MSLKPEAFGKFILLDKIAMGGMAEVYRAKAPGAEGIGKIIAIKRILPQFTANHEFIEMFKGEAKIAVNLTQANVAQIYEFGEEAGQFYLAMEFIDGRNLRQILSRCSKLQKALTIEQCVFVLAQVCNGMDYAHRCTDKNTGNTLSIIHRDMSPQNIMVSFEGEIKIVDFGIAKAESKIESTRAGTLKGKFGYMSPEQAEGADLDARTDIFSTGIVLWELLSGERLFIANNEINTIRKIRDCQIPSLKKINPNIHEELERIANKALAKDRSLRYQTAAEMYRDLNRFLYKVNPEFTQHDIGVFLKTLFKDDILEDRKRVAEFAKINFSKKTNKDTPDNQNTKTFTSTTLSEISARIGPRAIDAPNNLVPDNKVNSPVGDFDIKIDRVEMARKVLSAQQSKPNPNTRTGTNSGHQSNHTRTGTGAFNSQSSISFMNGRNRSSMSWIPMLLLVAAVGMGGYAFWKNPGRIMGGNDRLLATNTSELPSQAPALTKPTIDSARVFVHSVPAGAQILVDDVVQGSTPAEIQIPMHQKVRLAVRKEGYLPYSTEFIAIKSPEDFGATLQKAHFGYLNIDVEPASNTDVYINSQKLVEKSPIRRYPVASGSTVVVRAYNPYSDTSDQKSVVVRQDTEETIRLYPRKTK